MKKVMMTLLMVAAFSMNGFAQRGMQGVGLDFPFGTGCGNAWYRIGIKFQYNFSNYVRIEPSFFYSPIKKEDANEPYMLFGPMLNLHLFFEPPMPIRPYFIVGTGLVWWEITKDMTKRVYNDEELFMTPDAGLGVDFRLSHRCSMQVEAVALYRILNDSNYMENGKVTFNGKVGFTVNF